MKHVIATLLCSAALAGPAWADCFAEYKAKRDDPLRLHYGIMLLEGQECPGPAAANRLVQERLAGTNWKLLNVIGLSSDEPNAAKKANAGDFYLRF